MSDRPPRATETHPLTPERWPDFAALMMSRFDTRRCWCMALRLETSYRHRTPEANRRSMKRIVDTAGAPPGVLAYVDGEPVGWCAVAPRTEFRRINRSRALAPVDDAQAWAVVCFYVLRRARRQGVSRALLEAAVALAAAHGARLVEAYPVEGTRNPFRGYASLFREAGFREVARRQANRPVLRRRLLAARRGRT